MAEAEATIMTRKGEEIAHCLGYHRQHYDYHRHNGNDTDESATTTSASIIICAATNALDSNGTKNNDSSVHGTNKEIVNLWHLRTLAIQPGGLSSSSSSSSSGATATAANDNYNNGMRKSSWMKLAGVDELLFLENNNSSIGNSIFKGNDNNTSSNSNNDNNNDNNKDGNVETILLPLDNGNITTTAATTTAAASTTTTTEGNEIMPLLCFPSYQEIQTQLEQSMQLSNWHIQRERCRRWKNSSSNDNDRVVRKQQIMTMEKHPQPQYQQYHQQQYQQYQHDHDSIDESSYCSNTTTSTSNNTNTNTMEDHDCTSSIGSDTYESSSSMNIITPNNRITPLTANTTTSSTTTAATAPTSAASSLLVAAPSSQYYENHDPKRALFVAGSPASVTTASSQVAEARIAAEATPSSAGGGAGMSNTTPKSVTFSPYTKVYPHVLNNDTTTSIDANDGSTPASIHTATTTTTTTSTSSLLFSPESLLSPDNSSTGSHSSSPSLSLSLFYRSPTSLRLDDDCNSSSVGGSSNNNNNNTTVIVNTTTSTTINVPQSPDPQQHGKHEHLLHVHTQFHHQSHPSPNAPPPQSQQPLSPHQTTANPTTASDPISTTSAPLVVYPYPQSYLQYHQKPHPNNDNTMNNQHHLKIPRRMPTKKRKKEKKDRRMQERKLLVQIASNAFFLMEKDRYYRRQQQQQQQMIHPCDHLLSQQQHHRHRPIIRYKCYSGMQDLIAILLLQLESPSLASLLLKQLLVSHLWMYCQVGDGDDDDDDDAGNDDGEKSSGRRQGIDGGSENNGNNGGGKSECKKEDSKNTKDGDVNVNSKFIEDSGSTQCGKIQTQRFDLLSLSFFPMLQILDEELHSHLTGFNSCATSIKSANGDDDCKHDILLSNRVLLFAEVLQKWMSSWFCCHSTLPMDVILRVVDFLMASHPYMPLYLSMAVICHPVNRSKFMFFSRKTSTTSQPQPEVMLGQVPTENSSAFPQTSHRPDPDISLHDILEDLFFNLPNEISSWDRFDEGNCASYACNHDDLSVANDNLYHKDLKHSGFDPNSIIHFMEEAISMSISFIKLIPPKAILKLVLQYHGGSLMTYLPNQACATSNYAIIAPSSWTFRSAAPTDYHLIHRVIASTNTTSSLNNFKLPICVLDSHRIAIDASGLDESQYTVTSPSGSGNGREISKKRSVRIFVISAVLFLWLKTLHETLFALDSRDEGLAGQASIESTVSRNASETVEDVLEVHVLSQPQIEDIDTDYRTTVPKKSVDVPSAETNIWNGLFHEDEESNVPALQPTTVESITAHISATSATVKGQEKLHCGLWESIQSSMVQKHSNRSECLNDPVPLFDSGTSSNYEYYHNVDNLATHAHATPDNSFPQLNTSCAHLKDDNHNSVLTIQQHLLEQNTTKYAEQEPKRRAIKPKLKKIVANARKLRNGFKRHISSLKKNYIAFMDDIEMLE